MTESYNEVAKVEWSEKLQEIRYGIEIHAQVVKRGLNPYASSWSAVEDTFGYSLVVDFARDDAGFRMTRVSWLKAVSIDNYWSWEEFLET
jgi:hypothetical protein